eukprot:9817611-Alexandrium_andersonii.AAC.1
MTDVLGPEFPDRESRRRAVWSMVQDTYREHKVENHLPDMEWATFLNPKAVTTTPPVLANKVKAAQTRHFVPVLYRVWKKYARTNRHHP